MFFLCDLGWNLCCEPIWGREQRCNVRTGEVGRRLARTAVATENGVPCKAGPIVPEWGCEENCREDRQWMAGSGLWAVVCGQWIVGSGVQLGLQPGMAPGRGGCKGLCHRVERSLSWGLRAKSGKGGPRRRILENLCAIRGKTAHSRNRAGARPPLSNGRRNCRWTVSCKGG